MCQITLDNISAYIVNLRWATPFILIRSLLAVFQYNWHECIRRSPNTELQKDLDYTAFMYIQWRMSAPVLPYNLYGISFIMMSIFVSCRFIDFNINIIS